MSARKARHKAMQAIVRGSSLYGTCPELNHVEQEFAELGACNAMQPLKRQRFLQIMHAARALDTTLHVVIKAAGGAPRHGIGKMLHQLPSLPPSSRGHLSSPVATSFVSSICTSRNRYAHKAGAFPTSQQEADSLVAEVHACVALIL